MGENEKERVHGCQVPTKAERERALVKGKSCPFFLELFEIIMRDRRFINKKRI